MEYENIYKDFYSKYYTKTESLIKNFLIKSKSQKKTFEITINKVNHYLIHEIINNDNLYKNENLLELHRIFRRRYSIYEIDQIQEIFENEIKVAFNKIETFELPSNYNYTKLIKEIAFIELINEISRVLSVNSRLIEMFYKLNEFDEFEIRDYKNLSLESYPIFKKLHLKLYPQHYIHLTENENLEHYNPDLIGIGNAIDIENKSMFPSLFINSDVYDCFLEYQKHIIDFYTDYSYLKKRLEKEKLIHHHKDNDFMKIVFEQLQLISSKNYNEYCINGKLKSLQKSYSIQRQNNFNIVFDELI